MTKYSKDTIQLLQKVEDSLKPKQKKKALELAKDLGLVLKKVGKFTVAFIKNPKSD